MKNENLEIKLTEEEMDCWTNYLVDITHGNSRLSTQTFSDKLEAIKYIKEFLEDLG